MTNKELSVNDFRYKLKQNKSQRDAKMLIHGDIKLTAQKAVVAALITVTLRTRPYDIVTESFLQIVLFCNSLDKVH